MKSIAMKALSVKQPWANMIASGEKTIETRKWPTDYRGPLLIVSTREPRIEPAGFALAVVHLKDCRPMSRADELAACCPTYAGAYSWVLGDISRIQPFEVHGQLGVYDVEVIISTGGCTDTISQTIVVELSTGVITPLPLSFQLQPNPTEGELVITTRDNNEKTVTIVNTLGETISASQAYGTLLRLDLRGNAPGIYFVQVKDEVTGKTGVKKIVLQ